MKITQINIKEFCALLADLKEEITKNSEEFAEEGDHMEVFFNSANLLTKELKSVKNLEDLSIEQKKSLFPHISFVYNYVDYLTHEDPFEDFFDEEDDDLFDEDEDEEECDEESEMEELEETTTRKSIPIMKKDSSCCKGSTCKTTAKPKKK